MADYVTPVNQYLKSIDLQSYERYLPNSFNDSLSLLEKVNKVIYSLNQTNQLSNEVISKWNEFADWVNDGNIEMITETKISEMLSSDTLIEMIDTELMGKFKTEIQQLTDKKLEGVTVQLAEKATKQDKDELANYYYTPTRIPAIDGTNGINIETMKSADIYALFDEWVTKYPNSFTRTLFGMDTSGTIPVYLYTYTPERSKGSITLGGNIHGPGEGGDPKDVAIALYYFTKDIIENWMKNDKLAEIHWDWKVYIIPIQNPWGFDNNSRQNVNGVDLNRNWGFKWEEYNAPESLPGQRHYKGSAPFSEKETQYIRDFLLTKRDTLAYIDFHAWMNKNVPFKYVYASNQNSPMNGIAYNVTNYLMKKYSVDRQMEDYYTNMPQGFSYSYHVLGIPSCNPEFTVYTSDLPPRSSEVITRMVEFYGNIVYGVIKNFNVSRYRGALSQYNPTSQVPIVEATNTKITLFTLIHDTDYFFKDTGEIVIPPGVKMINIAGQVYVKSDSSTPQTVTLTAMIRKNGGRYSGYGVNKQTVTIGGTTGDSKEYCLHVNSLSVPVSPGDRFSLEVSQNGGGSNIKLFGDAREGTWFAIEVIK